MKSELLKKIESRKAVVGIVGLGYVGLPLMLRFSEVGYRVLGLDIDKSKVEALNAGRSYIEHIKGEHIKRARKAGFEATADFSRAKEAGDSSTAISISSRWSPSSAAPFCRWRVSTRV